MLSVKPPRNYIQTVSVYTRHASDCPQSGDPNFKRCQCPKWLYVSEGGKRRRVSAGTRNWSKAEDMAGRIRDEWDPARRKLRELRDKEVATEEASRIAVEFALQRWLASLRSKLENEHTLQAYVPAVKHIRSWAVSEGFVTLSEITPDAIDAWKTSWHVKAKNPLDRLGKTSAGRRLEKVKRFLKYCVRMRWLASNPAAEIDAITPDEAETLPLLSGRYEQVLEATYKYDAEMRPDDRFGEELRAIIQVMRWSGLRIGDVLMLAKSSIEGNRLTFRARKPGRKQGLILPDHVVAALNSLPARDTVDPRYFFWTGKSLYKSLTTQWHRKLGRLNRYLSLADYDGKPMRFRPHQLRDTFAVHQLLSGTSMQDLSIMLGHKSIRITEKYYAPWVPERQVELEKKMVEALQKMGAQVSLAIP